MAGEMKVTWFLNCGLGGYRFSHYLAAVGYTAALDSAVLVAGKYLKCLGTNVEMPLIVASDVDIRGDSQVRVDIGYTTPKAGVGPVNAAIIAPTTPKVNPAVQDPADEWWTAALLRTGTSATKASRQFMRLIPDSITVGPIFTLKDAAWRKAVQAYFVELTTQKFGMMGLNKTNASRSKVTKYTVVGNNGDVTIETNQLHGINKGELFHLAYFQPGTAKTSPNGTWICDDAPTTTTILVKSNQGMTVPSVQKKLGLVWSLTKTFTEYQLDQCSIVRPATRKAGVPLGVLKGRNKKR